MGLFTSTADRLRQGPALLLPFDPGMPQVLSALRLYDPAASVRKDRVKLDGGLELRGPIEITPDLSRQAGLPYGQTTAYLASGTGSFADFNAARLVSGLIVRLGGTIHPAPPNRLMLLKQLGKPSSALSQQIGLEFAEDPGLRPYATVLARAGLPAGDLIDLLSAYAPGLTVRTDVAVAEDLGTTPGNSGRTRARSGWNTPRRSSSSRRWRPRPPLSFAQAGMSANTC